VPSALLVAATLGSVPDLPFGLGEEIGWRGLLVPALAKITSFTRTTLISAAVWSVFHYPALPFADYHSNASLWYALTCFWSTIFSVSFAFA
jgi:membrane protease YdiL (CAAX protease family)